MLEKDHPKYYKRIKKIGEQCDVSFTNGKSTK